MGNSVNLIGKALNTGKVHEPILNADQLAGLEATPEKKPFDGDAVAFRLVNEKSTLTQIFKQRRRSVKVG